MGSIGSVLNSVNSSLLSELQAFSSIGNTLAIGSSPQVSSADQVNFSQAAQLFQQLQQLAESNPSEFKQVLTDGATQLQAAASQQTHPAAASFLNNLASRFQAAAQTGNLSSLHPSAPAGNAPSTPAPAETTAHHHPHYKAGQLPAFGPFADLLDEFNSSDSSIGDASGGTGAVNASETTFSAALLTANVSGSGPSATSNASSSILTPQVLANLFSFGLAGSAGTNFGSAQNLSDILSATSAGTPANSFSSDTSADILASLLSQGAGPQSNNNQIQILLASFVTSNVRVSAAAA